jgi:hypothetical protein
MAVTAALIAASLSGYGCIDILGIGDPQLDPVGAGGSTPTGPTTTTSGGGDGPPPECALTDPLCTQVDSDCLALEDNSAKTKYGFRVQQATIWKPDAFSGGLEYTAIFQAITMNLPECYLQGGGTVNILVEVDEVTSTARIGAAKPVANPFDGYAFVDEVVEVDTGVFFNVAPAIVSFSVDANLNVQSADIDSVALPLYLSQDASDFILVPVKKAHLSDTKISADRNCVGQHNAAGLSLEDGCLPDLPNGQKPFIEGGKLEGYVLLEEANDIIVTSFNLNRSLCLILAQDVGEFGDGGSPARCVYKDGAIKFPGDWCAATDAGADPNCHDAVYFGLAFAASGIKIVDPP